MAIHVDFKLSIKKTERGLRFCVCACVVEMNISNQSLCTGIVDPQFIKNSLKIFIFSNPLLFQLNFNRQIYEDKYLYLIRYEVLFKSLRVKLSTQARQRWKSESYGSAQKRKFILSLCIFNHIQETALKPVF